VNLVNWLLKKRPGSVAEVDDRIKITHDFGYSSTIWRCSGSSEVFRNPELADFYREFDGATLFSSTFKIAAKNEKKIVADVPLVFSLHDIQNRMDQYRIELPEPSIAFMYQAGIGIYSASQVSNKIFEYDTEMNEISTYTSLSNIIEEWLEAMEGG